MKVYTGPTIELITSMKRDGYAYKEYNPFQIGWTVGTGVKLFYMFGFNVAYHYYPIPVLTEWTQKRGKTFADCMQDKALLHQFLQDPDNGVFRIWKGQL